MKDELIEKAKEAALAGAIFDGSMSAFKRKGPVAVVRDIGCGACSGAAGGVAATLFREKLPRAYTLSIIVGSSASVATRYAYRAVLGPKPKKVDEDDNEVKLKEV